MRRDVAADASRLYATVLTDAESSGDSLSWRLTRRARALWWTGAISRRTQLEDGSISEGGLSQSRLDSHPVFTCMLGQEHTDDYSLPERGCQHVLGTWLRNGAIWCFSDTWGP